MLDTGPYLKAALFCESVIEGKDGVLSLIRVIDRLTVTAAGPTALPDMPATEHTLKLVLMLISGRAQGSAEVAVSVEPPGAPEESLWRTDVFLQGEDQGANLIAHVPITLKSQGLYWFRIRLDGEHLTSLPFRVIYRRVVPGTPIR